MNANNCKSVIGESNGIAVGWAKSLETLLADSIGVKYFQEFLKKEFSEENIIFWKECERLKALTDEEEIAALANQIYDRHLAEGAPLLVNVDQQAAKKAKENLGKPSPNVYELQQLQIFKLMKFDSFPRFLKSDVYQQCLILEEQGRLDPSDDESRRGKTVWYIRKSKSNAKDLQEAAERKRSILGFLSKGPKPGKQDTHIKQSRSYSVASFSDSSRRSSMASLPDNLDYRNSLTKLSLDENESKKIDLDHPLKVVFPSGSYSHIATDTGHCVRDALVSLCEKENTRLGAHVALLGREKRTIDMDQDVSQLKDQVLYLERKVQFRFDLPNNRSVGIEENPNRTLRQIIEPIMKRNGYSMRDYVITMAGSRTAITLDTKIVELEHRHLCAQSLEYIRRLRQSTGAVIGKPPLGDFRSSIKRLRSGHKSDDETFLKPYPADLKPVRSEESLSRSSGAKKSLSTLKAKEKQGRKSRSKSVDLTEDAQSDLEDVLVRTSSGRIDDQRGTLPKENLELPDFLKQGNVHSKKAGPRLERQRSLSSGVVVTPAQQQHLAGIDPDEFRPAKEVLAECSFASPTDRPSLYSVRSWSEIPTPERAKMRASSPKASALGQELDRELAFLGRLSVGSRSQGRDISALEMSKIRSETVGNLMQKSSFYISDDEDEKAGKSGSNSPKGNNQRRSFSSLSSSENDDNVNEPVLPSRCASVGSPRSPVQKQQKLESTKGKPGQFVVPQSPVFIQRTMPERKLKPRPLPLSSLSTEKLLKQDVSKGVEEKSSAVEGQTNVSIDRSISGDDKSSSISSTSPFDIIDIEDAKKDEVDQTPRSEFPWKINIQRTDSDASDVSAIDTSVTATGSVNDETVIMEDKDMSLGLLNLIQRKRVNKGRRAQEQPPVQPQVEKLFNGETIRGRKNERITFV